MKKLIIALTYVLMASFSSYGHAEEPKMLRTQLIEGEMFYMPDVQGFTNVIDLDIPQLAGILKPEYKPLAIYMDTKTAGYIENGNKASADAVASIYTPRARLIFDKKTFDEMKEEQRVKQNTLNDTQVPNSLKPGDVVELGPALEDQENVISGLTASSAAAPGTAARESVYLGSTVILREKKRFIGFRIIKRYEQDSDLIEMRRLTKKFVDAFLAVNSAPESIH
jgi:hypothetical protein